MNDKKLIQLLEQLHKEIEQTQNVDENGKRLLQDTRADIRELLDRSEGVSPQFHPSMIQRLQKTITHLEVTHPDLTIMLSELMNILSNAGI